MNKAYFKYILALLLFGTNGIVASFIHLSSYVIVLLRTMLGSLFLIAIFFISKSKFTFYRHKKQFVFLCISGIAMGASWAFLYEAYQTIGVSLATLTYYCGPMIVMALAPVLFQEKLTPAKIISFLIVLTGLFFVNGAVTNTGRHTWGLFCGILSALCYAFMIIFNKKASDITGLENSMLQLFISFLTIALFVGIRQGYSISIAPESILPIFILGIFNTGVGCYLYFSSISALSVQTVSICGYLEPLSAVIFSMIFLKELMLPVQMIGSVLMIGGAIYSELQNSRSMMQ